MVSRTLLGLVAASLVGAACGSGGSSEPSAATSESVESGAPDSGPMTDPEVSPPSESVDDDSAESSVPDSTPSSGDAELSPTQQALADVAVADLVERRAVDASAISVVEVEEVTWSDSSLGCPQKGMQYLQVITPGVRVVLEADGAPAFYHGTSAADLTYCAAPQPPVPN
ncbi:hypothetical protein [Ilumatobacter nonamiensis]|uniref:hypothetical protein n=1 Tax=Ilumatobacter nonamiensis TaxID=467093 RepID=UPI00034B07B3|nr:hypothetical protein [Ilumatobacter nonamiensis]